MSFDYNLRITIGVPLSEGQVRDCDTRGFHGYVEEHDDGEYFQTIGDLRLENTGEGNLVYYLGEHTYGSDWRRNPEEEFIPASEMISSLAEMKIKLRETLEPLGLWDELAFGVHIWASVG